MRIRIRRRECSVILRMMVSLSVSLFSFKFILSGVRNSVM